MLAYVEYWDACERDSVCEINQCVNLSVQSVSHVHGSMNHHLVPCGVNKNLSVDILERLQVFAVPLIYDQCIDNKRGV